MEDLRNLNPRVYTISAVIVGLLLIDDLDTYEQNALGNWLYLVGQIMISNASQQSLIQSEIYYQNINLNSKENKNIYNPLFYNLDELEKVISNTTPNNIDNVVKMLTKLVNDINIHIDNLKK